MFQKYKSRFSRRGRILRQRSLVVQRVLPSTPEVPRQISFPEVRNVSVGTKTVISIPANDAAEEPDKRINPSIDDTQKHFLGVLAVRTEDGAKVTNSNSSITSAMQILKEGEQQWLNSEVKTMAVFENEY